MESTFKVGSLRYYRANTHLIRHRTCIYKFSAARLISSPDAANAEAGVTSSAITALTQSPAIDVVGIGFTSGEISIYDVRADERLLRMFMEGGIRSLGFRSGTIQLVVCSFSQLNAWQTESRYSHLHLPQATLRCGTSMQVVVCCT